ncbi:MAG: hypothetical protein JOZ65_25120, partial [Chloroflexi bacterium]|nr:hypothetical protein [Chloroflexota bacterium]
MIVVAAAKARLRLIGLWRKRGLLCGPWHLFDVDLIADLCCLGGADGKFDGDFAAYE